MSVSDPTGPLPKLYHELADWWPLLSPPADYVEEAADLLGRLSGAAAPGATLLELGAGGGSLAFHLKGRFRLTLTDRVPAMLAVSRRINPEAEHLVGDMRTLRLDRTFDVVLIHDAIMYATDADAVRSALCTAAVHCRPGGVVAVIPDCTRETFVPATEHGGHDADDGRGLRYLEWSWDPDPDDDTCLVDYALVLRHADGSVTLTHDRHVEGLFARGQWLAWLAEAGLWPSVATDAWGRELFIATKNAG